MTLTPTIESPEKFQKKYLMESVDADETNPIPS
jgi:hypothetical protein